MVGQLCNQGNHTVMDIQLPNEQYLVAGPHGCSFQSKTGIAKLLDTPSGLRSMFKSKIEKPGNKTYKKRVLSIGTGIGGKNEETRSIASRLT